MKFLEKIKKIIEYIKNLEFQKKIILALIVVLVIANLVLGIILFTQKNVSVVKVESLINENKTSLIALGGNARRGSIKNTDYAFFKFTEDQKEIIKSTYDENGSCSVIIRVKNVPTKKQKELFNYKDSIIFKYGFLSDNQFTENGKLLKDDFELNRLNSIIANQVDSPEVVDYSIALQKDKNGILQVPQGFFVYSTIKSYIIGCCIAPANIGFDSSIDIPFYGFAPNGGVVDFSNSSFDFTGGSMVFPTVNTSLKTMPIYEISFSQNEENKSTLEDMSSVEVLFGGEKFFVNNMKGVENVQIPSSALKESFSYVNLKEGKSEVDSIILKLGKQNKNEKEILVPIITDPGLILNYPSDVWRTVDYEIFEWDRFDRILFFDTKDYDVQNRFFRRLAFFVEKQGYKGKILTNEQLEGKHGFNAHDYSADSMAKFFNKAKEVNVQLNYEEELLKRILLENNLIYMDGDVVMPNEGGIVSISQETPGWSRRRLLAHEGWHTLYFRDVEFRNYVSAVYHTMDQYSLQFLKDYFASQKNLGYDQNDEYLMQNEFMAYTMQQPLNEVGKNFVNWSNWKSVFEYTPDLAAYVRNNKGRGFEDAAIALNEFVFDKYGIVCGNIAIVNKN